MPKVRKSRNPESRDIRKNCTRSNSARFSGGEAVTVTVQMPSSDCDAEKEFVGHLHHQSFRSFHRVHRLPSVRCGACLCCRPLCLKPPISVPEPNHASKKIRTLLVPHSKMNDRISACSPVFTVLGTIVAQKNTRHCQTSGRKRNASPFFFHASPFFWKKKGLAPFVWQMGREMQPKSF